MSAPSAPRLLAALFRRLLRGDLGAEACDAMEREHRERRARDGANRAWLWYAGHLLRPDTWRLAVALRRRARSSRLRGGRLGAAGVSVLDVKLGLRMLVKNPALTAVSGLATATSIALGVLCFGFFQDFFLRPELPLPEGERIVSLGLVNDATGRTERRLLHDFVAWRAELESVEDVGAWRAVSRNMIGADGTAEPVVVAEMTASGFRVAGVPPLLGRWLREADEVEGAPPVVVIGHDVWQTRFGGDPEVTGRTLQLGRVRPEVVGVMPRGYAFPLSNALWTPLRWDAADHELMASSARGYAFGRLAPGTTRAQADAEMAVLTRRRAAEHPETHEHLRGVVMSYTDTHTGMDNASAGGVLVTLVLTFITLILAVPFVNVAILVYARTARRAGEIALRNALGASRRRVVTQLFMEALVLSGLAAVAGVTLGLWALERLHVLMSVEVMNQAFGGVPFWARQGRGPATLAYALGLTLLAAVVSGVVPGLRATGKRAQSNLARLSHGNGMRLGAVWTLLIVVQVGSTVAFVPPAASLAWSLLGDAVTLPTFATEDLLVAGLALPPEPDGAGEREGTSTPIGDLLRRLEEERGVTGVTYASGLPGVTFEGSSRIEIEGVPMPEEGGSHRAGSMGLAPDFFGTLDVPILSGRAFHRGDPEGQPVPVIVNRTLVRRILGDRNPLGRRLRVVGPRDAEPGPWHEIVGVVDDLTTNPLNGGRARSRFFRPLPAPDSLSRATLVLRVPSSPGDFASRLRRITTAVDPTLGLGFVMPVTDTNDPFRTPMHVVVLGIMIAVLSVLLLATASVSALMSFNVTQRRREIGIRSALGADPRRVLAGIFSRSAAQLGLGGLVGIAGAVFLERTFVPEMIPDHQPAVGVLLVVATLMVGAGLLATAGPARRALGIEPSEALREG